MSYQQWTRFRTTLDWSRISLKRIKQSTRYRRPQLNIVTLAISEQSAWQTYHLVSVSGSNERTVTGVTLAFDPHQPLTSSTSRWLEELAAADAVAVALTGVLLLMSSHPLILAVFLQRMRRVLRRHRRTSEHRVEALQARHVVRLTLKRPWPWPRASFASTVLRVITATLAPHSTLKCPRPWPRASFNVWLITTVH